MTKILVVEDDVELRKLLVSDFEIEGYRVHSACDGVEGVEMAKRLKPDLIVLDLMLPKMSGYDVCRSLRAEKSDVPILMLTAKGQEAEKVLGLEMGADDYMVKPFGGLELLARVKALLRRFARARKHIDRIAFDDVTVNFPAMEATRAGRPIELTAKEFQLLELLIRYRGEVVSRRLFLEEIWGYDEMPTTRTVDNQILTLRQKLAGPHRASDHYIAGVHGIGYKFVR